MYFEYWHLQKPPFDNVPDPSMYAECHASMENAIAETLFAIEEGNECLAVIIGDVGLGKTLSLRIIIDSLSPEKYQMALITNPSISFIQLLNEIIGQLTESPCNEKKKVGLLELFNKLLFQTADAGKKIVLLIDEANAITPANLESLRLLTNMQDDRRNLFTLVLAGQIELARRLEDPKRANLFQRIGTYSRIEKMASIEQLQTYVETRLRLAGATRSIFTEDTYPLFWKYSDQGVPRLINKIAKLSLKAGETHGLEQIDGQVVYQVGRQFEKITLTASPRGKSKKKNEEGLKIDERESISLPVGMEKMEETFCPESDQGLKSIPEEASAGSISEDLKSTEILGESSGQLHLPEVAESSPPASERVFEEIQVGKFKVRLHLPPQLFEQALSASREDRLKMAGQAAFLAIKKFSQSTSSSPSDPISTWSELRSIIFKKLEPPESEMVA